MKYQVTGNEYVSLPTIRESDGGLEGISFLHMDCKGMLEVCGDAELPLLRPFIEVNGRKRLPEKLQWSPASSWIPSFTARVGDLSITGTWLAPLGERGFGCKLSVENKNGAGADIRFGLEGCWARTLHSINESKPVEGVQNAYESGWNHSVVFDMRVGVSLFAFAPIFDKRVDYTYHAEPDGGVRYAFLTKINCLEGRADEVFWFGIGYEEVAAATSAKEMLRQGYDAQYAKTSSWLSKRERFTGDGKLDALLNRNMFFSLFFGSGLTIDTEEFVLVTSRSPRYYVSAAYWDRDSLLWSFPAILMADAEIAREMLRYVFVRQIKNVGIHSRYIDGTVLEPGFELDELCAPILALARYVKQTGDRPILTEPCILSGIERILRILQSKKHPHIELYETMLQPTDDMHVYKYITYDNVLVWRMLTDLTYLYGNIWPQERTQMLQAQAENVKAAVAEHCIKEKDGKRFYAWSVDLAGNWDIYDEPPGSLLLLAHYGFCKQDDAVWMNTVQIIRDPSYPYSYAGCPIAEIGCPHAPHPWVLSIANSLLSGNAESARKHLLLCEMDNGIACESVDEVTGESRTGDAFATCAGFLAYAIDSAFGKEEAYHGTED